MANIPFEISDSHSDEISGLLLLEEEFVVFEIRVRKWGLYKEPPELVKVEFGVIDNMRFERGFFKDSIFVVPKRSELLDAIPGDHKGELRLKVAKRYREEAQQFVAEVLRRKRKRRTV